MITGAVIKVTYQGDWDDVSGKIEVGIAMHDATSIGAIECVGPEDMKKTFMYECHSL